MTNQLLRKLKPTGGVKVDHASINKELREELGSSASKMADNQEKVAADDDLGDVLGEIEDLVGLEEGEPEQATDAQQEEPQATDAQEEEPQAEAEQVATDQEAVADAPGDNAGDAAPDGDVAEEAPAEAVAAIDDEEADVLGEVIAAAKEQSDTADALAATQEAPEADATNADEAAAATEEPAAGGEAEAEVEAPAAAEAPPVPAVKPLPKPVAPAPGRKGMLPPVRKITMAPVAAKPAPAPAAKAPAVKGAAKPLAAPTTSKPAVTATARLVPGTKSAAVKADAAAASEAETEKVAAKPATAAAAKKNVATKPVATAAAKPAAAAAAKPAAATAKPTAVAAAKLGTAAPKPASAAGKPAAAAATKPAVAVAAKPAGGAAAKPVTAGPAKPKAPPATKVIQARILPDDAEDTEEAKTDDAPTKPAAKKAAKPASNAKDTAGADAKKRVVAVGAKPSAGYTLFMQEHKQHLIDDEGMEVPEAGEQAIKDWAALGPEDKASYAARAKEQAGDGDTDASAPPARKAPQAKAAEAGPKYYTNGYMLFLEETRPAVLAANPEASFTDLGKLLGTEWRSLSKPEQEEFNTRAKGLNEASGAQPKPRKSKKKDDNEAPKDKKAAKTPAKKTGPAKTSKTPKKAAADDEGDIAEGAGMEVDGDDGDGPAGAPSSSKKRPATSRKRGGSSKKRRVADEEASDEIAPAAEDSGDESDREGVDWDAYPAEAILAKTTDGRYVVKRWGLGLDEYGIVDARAVKRQRLTADGSGQAPGEGEEAPAPLPVNIEMVDEFEAFERSFWASVQDRSEGGDLDLENLGDQSPLELCYYLGKLRENRMALHQSSLGRRDKDTMIRVPALRLSMVVQRVLTVERKRADELAARLAEVEARLAQYEAGGEAAVEAMDEEAAEA